MDTRILILICFAIICSITIIDKGDASSYHVAFLGRDHEAPMDEKIGELRYEYTDITIKSYNKEQCTNVVPTGNDVKVAKFAHSECPDIVPDGNELAEKGIKVESDDDFTLHVHQTNNAGIVGDGYLAIPDEHLGNEYFVATYCALGGVCQFVITAVEDATYVSVVFPNSATEAAACVNGMPIPSSVSDGTAVPFLINEYETLHFEGTVDFNGVYITASNKVAVVVGARDVPAASPAGASTPTTSNMIEQIIPVNKWGNEFVVIPNTGNVAGDIIVIVTKTDNTAVHIVGFKPFVIEHAGDSVVKRIDWQVHSWIRTSNPVMILQVMSVDLYNDTNDVTGLPSMVLVPHTKQWTSENMYFYCAEITGNLFALVTSSDATTISVQPEVYPASVLTTGWQEVEASENKAYVGQGQGTYVTITGAQVGGYGTCNFNSAFLLAADWSVDNTDCIPTTPVPGDDVDNDCNGQIDNEDCSIEDMIVNYESDQVTATGAIEHKTFAVRGISKVSFKVSTCDVAMVQLRTVADPPQVLTIAISPTKIVHTYCSPKCTVVQEVNNPAATGECSGLYPYELSWDDQAVLKFDDSTVTMIDPSAPKFDEMIVSAFVGSATFEVYLLEKDCAKLYRGVGEPDSNGAEFLIPVADDDENFYIVLTNVGDSEATFTVLRDNDITSTTILPQSSFWISEALITESSYNGIKLTVEGGAEVSVYVFRKASGGSTVGFSVIPTDVLGPSYHMFATNMTDSIGACDIYALSTDTEVTGLGTVNEDDSQSHSPDNTNSDFSYRRLLQGERPISVFCGNAQMPPRETLGKQHYIPRIELTALEATAQINIVATEDSTIVVIKGDYHQLDSVSLTGEEYYRNLEPSMIYDIMATKPIQVHLEIRGADWQSVVVIPPVEHYTDTFTLYGTLNKPSNYDLSLLPPAISAVSEAGVGIDVDLTQDPFNDPIPKTVQLSTKGFVMAFIHVNSKYYALTNGQSYADINEVCVVTPGTPGDGVDNDCDGLIDEEECSVTVVAGEIDVDIDADPNEDCKEGTAGPEPSSNALSAIFNDIPCSTGGGNGAPSGSNSGGSGAGNSGSGESTKLVIGGTTIALDGTGEEPPELSVTSIDNVQVLEIYSAGPSIATNFPTTTPAPGSTAAPEEYCQAICPCAWVEVQNYTAAEIEEKVEELIQKLTVSKEGLSSTVRKKVSASDERPTATTVGYVGVVWLATMIGAIVILDVTSIVRDLRQLIHNVRQMFQG